MVEYWEGFRYEPAYAPIQPDYSDADIAVLKPNGKCNTRHQNCDVQFEGKTHSVKCGKFTKQGANTEQGEYSCSWHLYEKQRCRQDGDECHVFGLGTNRTLPDYFAHCHLPCNITVGMNEYYEGLRDEPVFGPLTSTWTPTIYTIVPRPTH
ncbi:hypothetical protein MBLNU457_g2886t1 [Dothideomycetes sp. NU457]